MIFVIKSVEEVVEDSICTLWITEDFNNRIERSQFYRLKKIRASDPLIKKLKLKPGSCVKIVIERNNSKYYETVYRYVIE